MCRYRRISANFTVCTHALIARGIFCGREFLGMTQGLFPEKEIAGCLLK